MTKPLLRMLLGIFEENHTYICISRKPSRLAPPSKSHALELFIANVSREVHNTKSKFQRKVPDNLNKDCRQALNQLKNLYDEKDIIIRPFDKGTGFFLLQREDYIQRTLAHLSDSSKYEIVLDPKKEALKIQNDIQAWTVTFAQEIGMTSKVIDNIIPDIEKQTSGKIYLNPKAHKPPPYPGRLITTGCNSYIENLSAVTAHELKKVEVPYVVKDRQAFQRKIDNLNESGILKGKEIIHASIDVTNMFPNIPQEFGIQECKKHLDKRKLPHMFSTSCMVEAIKLTLENNLATFNGITYKQLTGTAMGPKNACDYADVAMNFIDQAIHNVNPDNIPNPHVPVDYNRFRDDCYIPWIGTEGSFMEFVAWLNTIHPSLKFTESHSKDGVEFLDLFVYSNEEGHLHTKLYSKPSDTHCYLTPNSCHQTHMVNNIPNNTARRVFQNNSQEYNYNSDKVIFTQHLINRGYSEPFIKDAFEKVEKLNRQSLYKEKSEAAEKKICLPLIIDTNSALPPVAKIIDKHKHILALDPQINKIIPSSC